MRDRVHNAMPSTCISVRHKCLHTSAILCPISLARQSMQFSGLLPLVGQGNLKESHHMVIHGGPERMQKL